jgi:hypothetical protein
MKESYVEGLANHNGPESCGGAREDAVEALTGVRPGRAIQPRNRIYFGVPTPLREAEGHIRHAQRPDMPGPRAVADPVHGRKHLAREPGDPLFAWTGGGPGRIGKSKDTRR